MKLSRTDLNLGLIDKTVFFNPNILPERNTRFLNDKIKCNISSQKNTSKSYKISGNLFLIVKYECVRCLDDNIIDHKLPFGLEILLSDKNINNDFDKNDYLQLEEDENHIDLSKFFADIIALAKPIKPLCMPKCMGICIICGGNKNRISCSCTMTHQTSVWDDLKKLNIK